MKKLSFAVLILLMPTSLLAQGGFIHDIVLQRKTLANPSITYTQPINGASIRVCTGVVGGLPCTPLSLIYSDAALTQAKANPTSTDVNGNFSFWALPGPYTIGITVNGVTTNFPYTVDYTNPSSLVNSIGSTNQVIFNNGTTVTGSADLLWDNTAKVFTVATGGTPLVRLMSDSGAGTVRFSATGTNPPFIRNNIGTGWFFTATTSQDFNLGPSSDPSTFILANGSGASMLNRGTLQMGNGSAPGRINLNDGTGGAGVFQGPTILVGVNTPEGAVTARVGSLFLRSNGGANTTLYVKESGTGNTGWVAK